MERGAPGGQPRGGRDREEESRHPHENAKEVACGDGAREDHCHCRHVDFLIGSYPRVGKDAIIQRIDKLDDTTGGILEDQAIFDNTLKSIRSHQEDYEAKLETMLVQQQGMVDKMIKYLENVEDRMKELGRRAGVPDQVPIYDGILQAGALRGTSRDTNTAHLSMGGAGMHKETQPTQCTHCHGQGGIGVCVRSVRAGDRAARVRVKLRRAILPLQVQPKPTHYVHQHPPGTAPHAMSALSRIGSARGVSRVCGGVGQGTV